MLFPAPVADPARSLGLAAAAGGLVGLSVAATVSGNHAVSGVHPAGSRQVRDLSIWDFGVAPCFAGRGAR